MHNYVQEALDHGLLDMSLVSKALDNLKSQSFYHQRDSQLEDVRFERFDIDMSEFKLRVVDPTSMIIRKRFMTYLDFDTISNAKKIRYKRSKFYRKEVSLFEIQDNKDIFDYNYITFVDGKLVDFINIIASDSGTQLVFNKENGIDKYGLSVNEFSELMKPGNTLTIIFLPNTSYGAYTLDHSILKNYSNMLSLQETGIANYLIDEGSYIAFVNSNNLGFKSQLVKTEKNEGMLKFFDTVDDSIAHINIFGFKYLYKKLDLAVGENFFYIDYTKMPVPIENIIAFEMNNGVHEFAHQVHLHQHYPNMYSISGRSNKPLSLFIFYNKYIDEFNKDFTNELDIYLNTLQYDNVDASALTFVPQKFEYSIKDFEKSQFYPDHEKYKLEKFTEWYSYNKEYLRGYLTDYLSNTSGFYINVGNIDLSTREKFDNKSEFDDPKKQVSFVEKRYLFILRNETNEPLNLLLFIDGVVYKPDMRFRQNKFEYFYIPADLIKSDTIISAQKYETWHYEFPFVAESENVIEFDSPIQVTIDDIVITDNNGDILDKKYYTIFYFNKVYNDWVELTNELTAQQAIMDKIKVDLYDPLFSERFTLHLLRDFDIFETTVEGEQDEMFSFNISAGNPNTSRYLFFYNGRLVQHDLYRIRFHPDNTLSGEFNVGLGTKLYQDGDKLTVVRVPSSYETVSFDFDVPENGIIDLRNQINIPLDLKWHDIYINGRLIDKRDIDLLTPNLAGIKEGPSKNNLLILAKSDYSLGLFESHTEILVEKLFDNDTNFKHILEELYKLNDVVEDDFLKDTIISKLDELHHLFTDDLLGNIKFINPDLHQFTPAMATRYPQIISNETGISPINGKEINVVMINPDLNIINSKEVYHIYPKTE